MLAYLDTLIGFAVVMLGISLLITILNQLVSAAFSYRGASLRWGLAALFKHISPGTLTGLKGYADQLSKEVLTHPLISDSFFSEHCPPGFLGVVFRRFQLASAIRGDELVGILNHLAKNPPTHWPPGLAAEINQLLGSASPVAARQIELLSNAWTALAATTPKDAVPLIQETVATVRESAGNLEGWFNAMMDRVSQQFAMYMRIWTCVFAAAISIFGCVDSIDLLDRLYRNGAFRASLVGAGPQIAEMASRVIPAGAETASAAVSQAVTDLFSNALRQAVTDAKVSPAPPVTPVRSLPEVQTWIQANIGEPQRSAVQQAFDRRFQSAMQDRAKDAAAVNGILRASGFDISLGLQKWKVGSPGFGLQFLGVLISIGLLSLGAPFWFNALKSLSNLRPVLATQQKTDDQGRSAGRSR